MRAQVQKQAGQLNRLVEEAEKVYRRQIGSIYHSMSDGELIPKYDERRVQEIEDRARRGQSAPAPSAISRQRPQNSLPRFGAQRSACWITRPPSHLGRGRSPSRLGADGARLCGGFLTGYRTFPRRVERTWHTERRSHAGEIPLLDGNAAKA